MKMSLLISLSVNFRTYSTFTNTCHLLQEYYFGHSQQYLLVRLDLPLHKNRQWSIAVLCKVLFSLNFYLQLCLLFDLHNAYRSPWQQLLLLLTQNIDDDILGQRISDTIISGTSVTFFILSTNDLQEHSDDSVIRDSPPGYCWFWFSASWAV